MVFCMRSSAALGKVEAFACVQSFPRAGPPDIKSALSILLAGFSNLWKMTPMGSLNSSLFTVQKKTSIHPYYYILLLRKKSRTRDLFKLIGGSGANFFSLSALSLFFCVSQFCFPFNSPSVVYKNTSTKKLKGTEAFNLKNIHPS